jgi:hypothetical protein
MEEIKYCAFIDVLGYSDLVSNPGLTIHHKIKRLESIYVSLASHFLSTIREINNSHVDQIFIRSFSDCFYLDCTSIEPLLIAIERIFNYTIGFYINIPVTDATTPLLRCGIVKDWVVKFRDIGAMTNNTEELNPVGLAVARAYHTSEKSKLSGMRIIISPEVINDLNVLHLTIPDFECYIKDILVYDDLSLPYYFKHITLNECDKSVDLYELLWPQRRVCDHPWDCVTILEKIKPTIPKEHYRQFEQTVKLFLDSFCLSPKKMDIPEHYQRDRAKLTALL